MTAAWWMAVAALAIAAAALGATIGRVAHLERRELMLETPFTTLEALAKAEGSTRVSARLATVDLHVGERALFELCARDSLAGPHFVEAFDVVIFRWDHGFGEKPELMLRVPLDREHLAEVKRGKQSACMPLGGGIIEQAGKHSFDLVFAERPPSAEVTKVPLRARILASTALTRSDRALLRMFAAAVLLLLFALFALPRSPLDGLQPEPSELHGLQLGTTALALGAAGALVAATFVPVYGSAVGLTKGALIVAFQVIAALLLTGLWAAPRRSSLGLRRPRRLLLWLAAAPVAALVLGACARFALQVVPRSGEAPLEAFVSWPSGLLAYATVGVLAPVAEELFFRGYLYRVALPLGRLPASAITLGLFVALHLAQSWGNWGAVLSVTLTGAVLTWMRVASDSLLPAALAHVLYNASLSLQAV